MARMQVFELPCANSMYVTSQHISGSAHPQIAKNFAAPRIQGKGQSGGEET